MVDTRDLKSLGQKCPCGFDSRLRHKRDGFAVPLVLLPLSPTPLPSGEGRRSRAVGSRRPGFRRPSCAIAPLPNPCLKTELLPETMQEGHGRHSLCNSVSGLFHRTPLGKTLLQKHEEDSENQAHEGGEVVPMKGFTFEEEGDNESEDDQRDNFLNDF